MGKTGTGPSSPVASAVPAGAAGATRPVVEMVGISKRYGTCVADDGVDLAVRGGEVLALVGENGAGKTTLMKVLAGLVRPDAGTIRIGDRSFAHLDPATALALGVGMVHQHYLLVDGMTVAENVVLGHEPRRGPFVDRGAARRVVRELAEAHGLEADPDAIVGDLSVGERQRVEILKAIHRGAGILVLDEPTAVLTPREAEGLFRMARGFADAGKAVVLITHRLEEVLAASDRVTVLRAGRVVATTDTARTTAQELARWMVGRDLAPPAPGTWASRVAGTSVAEPALEVRDLALDGAARPALDRVTLRVRPGEVLGIAGVQGNGQSELLEVIAGLRRPRSGTVRLAGRDVTALDAAGRIAAGLAHVPEERNDQGLVGAMTVAENAGLGRQRELSGRRGRWDRAGMERMARRIVDACDVRPPRTDLPAAALSGGNAQKLVVGRELDRRPAVLLAGQPTRGVDVGAVEAIHGALRAARDGGTAILLVSADLAELLALSDRVAVMFRGRVVAEVDAADADVGRLGEWMGGVT